MDDYVTKPIDYKELLLRIKTLLHRSNISNKMKINIGDFEMDENDYLVKYNNNNIEFTKIYMQHAALLILIIAL